MQPSFGNRLSLARKMKGLSLQGLADLLGGEWSKQSLSKYENDQVSPNSNALVAFAAALGVTVDFFFSSPEVQVELRDFEYRKRASVTQKETDAIEAVCTELINRYLTLEQLMQEPVALHPYKYPHVVQDGNDVELAASELRKVWNLGNDPIPNVIAMLENKGYRVVEVPSEADFDGLQAFGGHGVAVIGLRNQPDICRKRFTALHELAHHILTFPDDMPHKTMETLCHRFAAAVIFPAEQAKQALHKDRFHFYLAELIGLKTYWGLSIGATFARARDLGLISQHVYVKFLVGYKKRGYHVENGEPGSFAGNEKPIRFDQLLYRGLAEGLITLPQAVQLTGMTMGELRNQLDSLA
jgi:Zn-dependent peptidase ImmA (M78 family)/transcriptional regulator with XRE-family HTH domain